MKFQQRMDSNSVLARQILQPLPYKQQTNNNKQTNQRGKMNAQLFYQQNNKDFSSPKMNDCNTTKILTLQEELLNCKKDLSKRQAKWQKQRNTLLNQQQINNMEIIQTKQRLANMAQINQTLTEALANGGFMGETLSNIKNMSLMIMGSEITISQKPNAITKQLNQTNRQAMLQPNKAKLKKLQIQNSQIKTHNDSLSKKLIQLTEKLQQITAKLHEKERKIEEIYNTAKKLHIQLQKKEEELLKCYRQISNLSSNQIQKSVLGDAKKQWRKSTEKMQSNRAHEKELVKDKHPKRMQYENRQKISKKELTLHELDSNSNYAYNKKYPFNNDSSYLMVKPTSDHPNISRQYSDNTSNESYYQNRQQNSLNLQEQQDTIVNKMNSLPPKYRPSKKNNIINIDDSYPNKYDHYYQEENLPDNFYKNDEFSEGYYSGQEQDEQILCEICHKVFDYNTFQQHLKRCGNHSKKVNQIRELLDKKKLIEGKISSIQEQDDIKHNKRDTKNGRYSNTNTRKSSIKYKQQHVPNYQSQRYQNGLHIKNYHY